MPLLLKNSFLAISLLFLENQSKKEDLRYIGEASVEVGKGDPHVCFTGGQLVLSKVFYSPSDKFQETLP